MVDHATMEKDDQDTNDDFGFRRCLLPDIDSELCEFIRAPGSGYGKIGTFIPNTFAFRDTWCEEPMRQRKRSTAKMFCDRLKY